MVMVGAASPFLPIGSGKLEDAIEALFAGKDEKVIEANRKAFCLGREAAL
jgi:Pyruvate/2-oxoacid:ferredoxin oxidoreductase gamma subunit